MSLNVELLEQSFALVKPEADSLMDSFYNNLFTDYPAAKPLFTHTDMAKQKQQLKGAIVMVVDNLRNPDVLSSALKGLGARHVKYGALPEHYPLVGNSLLKALEQHAGSAWTADVKEAWVGAYGAITELMLDGADYTSQDIQLEQPPIPNAAAQAAAQGGPVPAATVSPDAFEPTKGIGSKAAAGIIGGSSAALALLLLILL